MIHDDATESPDESSKDRPRPQPRPPEGGLMQGVREWLRENFGHKGRDSLREAVEEALEEHEDDSAPIDPEEKRMLLNLLEFGELEVRDVMVPRTEIIAISKDSTLDDLAKTIMESGHSRVLVYDGSLDHVVGMVHAKDLIRFIHDAGSYQLSSLIRPVFAVPPSMMVVNLLARMRSRGMHLAVVVDEYGGTDGLVTLEDLFERIVGDIHDEHDEDESQDSQLVWVAPDVAQIDARMSLEELEAVLDVRMIPDSDGEDFETLGGLLFHLFGRVPSRGESIRYQDIQFEITSADDRRITSVRLTLPEAMARRAASA